MEASIVFLTLLVKLSGISQICFDWARLAEESEFEEKVVTQRTRLTVTSNHSKCILIGIQFEREILPFRESCNTIKTSFYSTSKDKRKYRMIFPVVFVSTTGLDDTV